MLELHVQDQREYRRVSQNKQRYKDVEMSLYVQSVRPRRARMFGSGRRREQSINGARVIRHEGKSEEIPQPAAFLQPSRSVHVDDMDHVRESGVVFSFAHIELGVRRRDIWGRTPTEDFSLARLAFAEREERTVNGCASVFKTAE